MILDEYILSYNKICNVFNILLSYNYIDNIKIGKTTFGYDINCIKVGSGKKHVLIIGTTHGTEIITTNFCMKLIDKVVLKKELLKEYTFHIIPILNPEGYIISTCNIIPNIYNMNLNEFEKYARCYLNKYNLSDEKAKLGKKIKEGFYGVIAGDIKYIDNIYLRKSVKKILENCNLSDNVLPIWSANGLGVDQNSNSIHRFNDIKKLRKMQKCANLRYNIIPVTIPSPMSYPGEYIFDRSPENNSLYKYIKYLYTNYDLKYIFSYHSTGGEVYSLPEYYDDSTYIKYKEAIDKYIKYTNYKLIEKDNKYGVMDYYRLALKDTVTLTIELSFFNGNPIGPYSNISLYKEDFNNNYNAILSLL